MRSWLAALGILAASFAAALPAAGPQAVVASAASPEAVDYRLSLAVKQAVEHADSFTDSSSAHHWIELMSTRLARRIGDPFYRTELLRVIHREATVAGLAPELVLALIQVESGFDRFAVSPSGARGFMHYRTPSGPKWPRRPPTRQSEGRLLPSAPSAQIFRRGVRELEPDNRCLAFPA